MSNTGEMMRRAPLTSSGPGDGWRGLLLDVPSPAVPSLRVEVTSGRRLRIVQGERPILWARIAADHYGVDIRFDTPIASVLPPIEAMLARTMANADPSAWHERWAHRYLDMLVEGSHPLHRGWWVVEAATHRFARHRGLIEALVHDEQAGRGSAWLDWDIGDPPELLPLRPLSTPGSARVKAWAKAARERTLPPVLVWWVAGLQRHVVLDGHDRLVAGVVAGVDVPVLAVSGVLDREHVRKAPDPTDVDRRRLDRALQERPDDVLLHEGLAAALVRAVARHEAVPRTRAWMASVPPTAWPFD